MQIEIKTTTKSGIRRIFNKVTKPQWANFFARQKDNGLIEACEYHAGGIEYYGIMAKQRYNIKRVAEWLVDHGLYTINEIKEIL